MQPKETAPAGFSPAARGGRRASVTLAAALALALPFGGCKKEEPAEVKAVKQLAELGKEMAAAGEKIREAQARAPLEAVDFHKLKDLLPDTLAGMKRTQLSGEKSGAVGMVVARADAHYEGAAKAGARVRITDVGAMTGVMAMATFGWAKIEFDRETDDGYEKSTTISGHKAIEKYNNKRKDGKLQVMVADRFHVEADGENLAPADLRKAIEGLDLAKLAALK